MKKRTKKLPKSPYDSYCHTGVIPSVIINNADELTKLQSIIVLRLLIEIIKKEPLWTENSDTLGNKHNLCNWGLCTNSEEVYFKPEMHTFPADFVKHGRISRLPLYLKTPCPLRGTPPDGNGCFWSCLAFNGKITRQEALKRYEATIQSKLENKNDTNK